MRKSGKFLTAALLSAVMICAVSGCGGSTKETGNKTEEQNSEQTAPQAEDTVKEEAAGEETAAQTVEEVIDTRTPVQKFWSGDWYGILWITNGTGNYESYKNQYWDAMGTIDVDAEGNADMILWYEAVDRSNPVAHVQLTISEDSGSGEMGAAISESGWMFVNSDTGNGDVAHADWIIDPMTDPISTKYGNDMIHIEGAFMDGSGGIYYHFFLRKWGTLWDDVAKDPDMLTPALYEEWYKPLVQDGYAMPENIGDQGSVLMADAETAAIAASAGTANTAAPDTAQADSPAPAQESASESTYDGGELVLLDDEYCKIVVTGTGSHPYNESWIGYLITLTNKSDFSIYFTSYAEPDQQVQTLDSLGSGNTCYYKGEKCKTHFGETIKAGVDYDKACLVIDGVTDVSQLGDVKGYITVVNNETGEILNNVPYSF